MNATSKPKAMIDRLGFIEVPAKSVSAVAASLVLIALTVGAIALLALATAIFVNIWHTAWHHPGLNFQDITTSIINEVLLIFIVVELVETAYHQVNAGAGRALGRELVEKLLVIGILSSVRHLLSVGAELSTNAQQQLERGGLFTHILQGLGVNAGIVVFLVFALIAFGRWFPKHEQGLS